MLDLRITDVKTYIVPPSFEKRPDKWCDNKMYLFIKLETDKGIDGWGEAYVLRDRERNIALHVQELKRYLVGFDPSNIKYFQHWAYEVYAQSRPGIDLYCALSGIEIAMWDIMGKYYNTADRWPHSTGVGSGISYRLQACGGRSNRESYWYYGYLSDGTNYSTED